MPIVIIAILMYIGYSVYFKNYFNFQPQGKRYKSSSDKINIYLNQQQHELVQFDSDEIEALSGNVRKQNRNLFFISTPNEGILNSIYHEPFVAFKREFYSANKTLGIIGMATKNHRFTYILKKDHVDIFIDDQAVGTIQNSGLTLISSRKVVARYKSDQQKHLIYVQEKPVGEVTKKITFTELPQRIITVYDPLEAETFRWLECIAFYLTGLNLE